MNPADFRGLYFYKLLIPAFTWGSILGTFLGPFFFPAAWFLFVAAFMVVFVLVSLSQVKTGPPSASLSWFYRRLVHIAGNCTSRVPSEICGLSVADHIMTRSCMCSCGGCWT